MAKLNTMGFLKSTKKHEERIAILPQDLIHCTHPEQLYFEEHYAKAYGIDDEEYRKAGSHVTSTEQVLKQAIVCDTKIGESKHLTKFHDHTIVFGWIHAMADKKLTDLLMEKRCTCYAWEDMYEDHRHLFWRNNQLAGQAAVLHSLSYSHFLYANRNAAILGRGDVAFGAFAQLSSLGANVRIYNREEEALFQKELPQMDIVVMAVRWDTMREDHIITDHILKQMKPHAIILDVSADDNGAIAHSYSTDMESPIYKIQGIRVYSVNHTPSIFYEDASIELSKEIAPYLNLLLEGEENQVLKNCNIMKEGVLLDQAIIQKQHRI